MPWSQAGRSPVAGRAYFVSQGEPVELWQFVNRVLALAGLPPLAGFFSKEQILSAIEHNALTGGNLFADTVMALRFYSRLPTGKSEHEIPNLSRIAMALPFASLIIGGIPALALFIAVIAGVPPISATSTTGSTRVLDIRKMCWIASRPSAGGGGRSSRP